MRNAIRAACARFAVNFACGSAGAAEDPDVRARGAGRHDRAEVFSPSVNQPDFPFAEDDFMGAVVDVLKHRGHAPEVGLLAVSVHHIQLDEQPNDSWAPWYWALRADLDTASYATLDPKQLAAACDRIREVCTEVLKGAKDGRSEGHAMSTVACVPRVVPAPSWRNEALRWLRGEGITNQGRVRSDNIATRTHDGLLFRSTQEIELYKALKKRGVVFAPLPVFLRGGQTYKRIEPDFLVIHKHVTIVVEVDGDTVHRELPAEAEARLRMMTAEGAESFRVLANECDTPDKADARATEIIAYIERRRR